MQRLGLFHGRVGRFAVDYRSELQAPGQDTACDHRFWDRTAGGDTLLVHGDCYVSTKTDG